MPFGLETVIKALPKLARTTYEALAPETKAFVAKALPLSGDNWAPILNVAKKQKWNPGEVEKLEQVLQPLTSEYLSQTAGISRAKAFRQVTFNAEDYLHQMTMPVPEAAALGKAGKKISIPELDPKLIASTSPIRYQAQFKNKQTQLAKARSLGDTKQVDYLESQMAQLAPMMKGQKVIQDLPWRFKVGTTGVSTKTREAYAFGLGQGLTLDQAAAVTWQDRFVKTLQPWWRALTGKDGPGGGFKSLARDKQFIEDMSKVAVDTWPQTEKYYKLASTMQNLVSKYKFTVEKSGEEAAAGYLKSIEKLKPKVIDALADLNTRRKPIYSKYFDQPDFRIALYRQSETRHWVDKLMSPGEKQVAKAHEELMGQVRDQLVKHNIPVLDQQKEYVTHLLKNLTGKGNKVTLDRMNKFLPSIIKFQQRNPGSLNFFPSIHASTEAYIPMAARKIAGTTLASKWKPIIEKDLKHWPEIQKAEKMHLEQYLNKSMDENFWEKTMRQLTWWTYFTKVGLSVPVAFKHAIKFGGLIAMHPRDALATMPLALKGGMQLALQRFGVKPGVEARIMRNMNASRNLLEDLGGLVGHSDFKSRAFQVTNLFSGSPVNWVEAFERGTGTLAAMNKAARTGLSYKKLQQGMYSTILENSFLGRADNFLWLNKSWQRFMAIFAYTPSMIIDRSIRWASRGTSREAFITDMKAGVLQEAWRMPRDVFGTTYTKHLLAFATLLGAAEMYAQHHGVKPWWILQMGAGHLPSSVSRPIPYEFIKTAEKRGGSGEAFASTMFDFMATFPSIDKAKQAWRGQLTKTSGGDPLFHALGIPSAEAAKKFKENENKFGGRGFGTKWETKHADELRDKTLFGPLYNEAIKPWLRRP